MTGSSSNILKIEPERLFAALVAIVALAVPLRGIFVTIWEQPATWVNLLFDDAYYYLGVARHVALGEGSMFSAPFETNGYQPLWLLLASGVAFLVHADRTLTAAGLHLIILLCSIFALMFSRVSRGRVWPAAVTLILFPFVSTAGLETALMLPLGILYFEAGGWRKRGALASLLFLARLDAIGLIVGRALVEIVVDRRIEWRQHAVLGATVISYVLTNLVLFGTPLPVSGQAKAIGLAVGDNWRVGVAFLYAVLPVSLAAMQLALFRPMRRQIEPIAASAIAVGCSAAYYALFSAWPIWSWYIWPVSLMTYFTLCALAEVRSDRSGPLRSAAEIGRAAGLLVMVTYLIKAVPYYHARTLGLGEGNGTSAYWIDNVKLAAKINSGIISANGSIAMGDRAGSFGYFLDDRFRFLQTEGLVGSYGFVNALRSGQAEAYLAKAGVGPLLVDRTRVPRFGSTYALAEPAQSFSRGAGPFLLCFPESAILPGWGEVANTRVRAAFDFAKRIPCPAPAEAWFKDARARFAGIHQASY